MPHQAYLFFRLVRSLCKYNFFADLLPPTPFLLRYRSAGAGCLWWKKTSIPANRGSKFVGIGVELFLNNVYILFAC